MRVVVIHAGESEIDKFMSVEDIQPKLEDYYRLCECSTIDITYRRIQGREYAIICDDEGMFVKQPKLAAATVVNGKIQDGLVGNLIITVPGEEDLKSVDEQDVLQLHRAIRAVCDENGAASFCILLD